MLLVFILSGAGCLFFLVNHLFLGGRLINREKGGWKQDVAKYGVLLMFILAVLYNVFYN